MQDEIGLIQELIHYFNRRNSTKHQNEEQYLLVISRLLRLNCYFGSSYYVELTTVSSYEMYNRRFNLLVNRQLLQLLRP
ncbi:hypothetical protein Y032_0011g1335 [Ancylostoma ceylanicum]|uniref:Uncharacterized protein n=1 Tax=Ancylostoma ceylanicum TaxID=53326 RepID=A0A016VE54_9BILA|nr:hypothetical protein Y032_0011g1335 [Ancylostoma ceylanicum]